MYLFLGNLDIERSNYEGAIQSFERAGAQLRGHTSRALLVVSLVSFFPTIPQCIEINRHF